MSNIVNVDKLRKAIMKKQETINKHSKKLKTAPKYIFAGWDEKSGTYPEQEGKPVWYIAEIHERGLGDHERKDMTKNTEEEHGESWQLLYAKLVNRYLKRGRIPDYFKIAEKVGERMKYDLENYVRRIDLVDTHRLVNSVIIRYRRRQ